MATYTLPSGCELDIAGDPSGMTNPVVTVNSGVLTWTDQGVSTPGSGGSVVYTFVKGTGTATLGFRSGAAEDRTVDGVALTQTAYPVIDITPADSQILHNPAEVSIDPVGGVGVLQPGDYTLQFMQPLPAQAINFYAVGIDGSGAERILSGPATAPESLAANYPPYGDEPWSSIDFTMPAGYDGTVKLATGDLPASSAQQTSNHIDGVVLIKRN